MIQVETYCSENYLIYIIYVRQYLDYSVFVGIGLHAGEYVALPLWMFSFTGRSFELGRTKQKKKKKCFSNGYGRLTQ